VTSARPGWIGFDGRYRRPGAAPRRICATRNRRKDEFLAMLWHELRNPLVPIRNDERRAR
jgi:signal transduction histidine kinase